MLRATSAAPRLRASKGETCLYSVPMAARSSSFEHRPVDGAGQAVLGELALAARVDDGVERVQRALDLGRGDALEPHRVRPPGRPRRRGSRSRCAPASSVCCSAGPSTRKVSSTRSPSVADLGQLQVDVVARQHARDAVEQARAVAGRDAEQPALRALVGRQRHARRDRKAAHAARDAAAAGLGQRAGGRAAPARPASPPARSGRGTGIRARPAGCRRPAACSRAGRCRARSRRAWCGPWRRAC